MLRREKKRWLLRFWKLKKRVARQRCSSERDTIEALDYAVCYLQGKEGSSEFYAMETHNLCLEEIKRLGLQRKEDDWCFERYNCPRFTTPDADGNVILDYGIAIM